MAIMKLPVEEGPSLIGTSLGTTEWQEITQERVNQFAEATLDRQWIHTDPERAARESPFRRTIAHGYFTLGLVPACFWELIELTGARLVINYGANKVRFPGPVPIPSRVRMSAKVLGAEPLENGFTFVVEATIEVENQSKPAMIAEVLYRYYT